MFRILRSEYYNDTYLGPEWENEVYIIIDILHFLYRRS